MQDQQTDSQQALLRRCMTATAQEQRSGLLPSGLAAAEVAAAAQVEPCLCISRQGQGQHAQCFRLVVCAAAAAAVAAAVGRQGVVASVQACLWQQRWQQHQQRCRLAQLPRPDTHCVQRVLLAAALAADGKPYRAALAVPCGTLMAAVTAQAAASACPSALPRACACAAAQLLQGQRPHLAAGSGRHKAGHSGSCG